MCWANHIVGQPLLGQAVAVRPFIVWGHTCSTNHVLNTRVLGHSCFFGAPLCWTASILANHCLGQPCFDQPLFAPNMCWGNSFCCLLFYIIGNRLLRIPFDVAGNILFCFDNAFGCLFWYIIGNQSLRLPIQIIGNILIATRRFIFICTVSNNLLRPQRPR